MQEKRVYLVEMVKENGPECFGSALLPRSIMKQEQIQNGDIVFFDAEVDEEVWTRSSVFLRNIHLLRLLGKRGSGRTNQFSCTLAAIGLKARVP